MRIFHIFTVIAVTACLAAPNVAHAQSGGAIANISAGVGSADETTSLEISGGAGYRFNRVIGFGIELTHMPSVETNLSRLFGSPIFIDNDADEDGTVTMFTSNVRVEIPTTVRRVIPYVVGGGGVASVTVAYPVYYALASFSSLAPSISSTLGPPSPPPSTSLIVPGGPRVFRSTTVQMALTLGGGASLLLSDHVAVDVDLRAFKLLGEEHGTMGRFGVGASYRF
jgi:opacity protein-like surface antigen